MHLTDVELHAFVAGALDPGRARTVSDEVAADVLLAARVQRIRDALSLATETPWRLPPPRLGTFAVMTAPAMVMGPSSRVRLTIPMEAAPSHHRVVVLGMLDFAWEVLFPATVDDEITLADLPQEGGNYILDVRKGPLRWAVALPELIDRAAGWAGLQADIAAGRVSVGVVAGG